MTLVKSISGIRGTIGGNTGDNLTPLDAVKFAAAYGQWLQSANKDKRLKVVLGRDARPSGAMIQALVQNTLVGLGIDVLDLGLSTTPTVEMAVVFEKADGGIILTASHNPVQWNALKLLNAKGEFLSGNDGAAILAIAEADEYDFVEVHELGTVSPLQGMIEKHVDAILDLPYVDVDAIRKADLKVAVDAVNSTGGLAIPILLDKLGVEKQVLLYCEPNGQFPHNPEPLKEHLGDIMSKVKAENCDLGIVVDPDVDRLALISENGEMFGEEYTLVACADYLLGKLNGPVVSNLSSSRALRDLAGSKGYDYFASAVGEVNVVATMKEKNAVLGGEGNGGVILPDLHYGRDSLVGIALILSHLATSGKKMSELRTSYPEYYMAKNKIQLEAGMDVDGLLDQVKEKYSSQDISTIDGVKIDFADEWVHLRKSNTEPIIRVYTEAHTQERATELGEQFVKEMQALALA
ncbi:MAG TPA: phosphoglucosamine mutase [Cryomorphaceae bacterium]|nr:phosphoglucosamine mutase [Cryomorphaceae bacterium]